MSGSTTVTLCLRRRRAGLSPRRRDLDVEHWPGSQGEAEPPAFVALELLEQTAGAPYHWRHCT
jgi:hypothetical protein